MLFEHLVDYHIGADYQPFCRAQTSGNGPVSDSLLLAILAFKAAIQLQLIAEISGPRQKSVLRTFRVLKC